jgi:predicted metal-dependent enzyme (double-stranded beta helix superfamily)
MSKSSSTVATVSRRNVLALAAAAAGKALLPLPSAGAATISRSTGGAGMNIDRFVEDCILASHEAEPQLAVHEVLARAVAAPRAVRAAIGEPENAGLHLLHRSKSLTIFAATWTPQMNLMPHNHLMWALIGIYAGREDNIMWRKTPESIEAFGAAALFEGDTAALPVDAIHSVTNPLLRFTGGIHVYGGDFFDTTRTQWNPETLSAEPSDGAVIRKIFERENERLLCSKTL